MWNALVLSCYHHTLDTVVCQYLKCIFVQYFHKKQYKNAMKYEYRMYKTHKHAKISVFFVIKVFCGRFKQKKSEALMTLIQNLTKYSKKLLTNTLSCDKFE